MTEPTELDQHKLSRYALNHIQIAFELVDILDKALLVETNRNLGYQVIISSIAEYLERAKEDIKQIQANSNESLLMINRSDYENLKHLVESIAAEFPSNANAQNALRTMEAISTKANI